jgi:hypothetical protein
MKAFVRAVATAGDSPTVIRRVAENAAYVYLCREIVQMDKPGVPPPLHEACRAADITPPRLMARLAPVAQALRLVPGTNDATYYNLLGVPPDSDATVIRQAYRKRARDLHPDHQSDQTSDTQAFTELTTAYQTLRDPAAKEAYDARRDVEGAWLESQAPIKPPRSRRARFTAVLVVVLLLVAATLLLDRLYRENARRTAFRTIPSEVSQSTLASTQPPDAPPIAPPRDESAEKITDMHKLVAVGPAPAAVAPEITPDVMPAASLRPDSPPPVSTPEKATKTAPVAPPPPAPPSESSANVSPPVVDHRRIAVIYTSKRDARLSMKLASYLTKQGYPAPSISQASSEQASNIRYFNSADRNEARSLKRTVHHFLTQATGHSDLPLSLKNLSRRYPSTEKGLLEVWLNTRPPEPIPPAAAPVTIAKASTTPAQVIAPPSPSDAAEAVDTRIRAFLDHYCRAYESRDADRLANLFDTAATENGQPFSELLPRYRANLARIEHLSYQIKLDRWQPLANEKTLSVQGRFFAIGQLDDHKEYKSEGSIALDIVPHGDSYRVMRLAYQIE